VAAGHRNRQPVGKCWGNGLILGTVHARGRYIEPELINTCGVALPPLPPMLHVWSARHMCVLARLPRRGCLDPSSTRARPELDPSSTRAQPGTMACSHARCSCTPRTAISTRSRHRTPARRPHRASAAASRLPAPGGRTASPGEHSVELTLWQRRLSRGRARSCTARSACTSCNARRTC